MYRQMSEWAMVFAQVFMSWNTCPMEFVFDNGSKQTLTLEISGPNAPGGRLTALPATSHRFEAVLECASCRADRIARVTDESGSVLFESRGKGQRVYCGDVGCRAD